MSATQEQLMATEAKQVYDQLDQLREYKGVTEKNASFYSAIGELRGSLERINIFYQEFKTPLQRSGRIIPKSYTVRNGIAHASFALTPATIQDFLDNNKPRLMELFENIRQSPLGLRPGEQSLSVNYLEQSVLGQAVLSYPLTCQYIFSQRQEYLNYAIEQVGMFRQLAKELKKDFPHRHFLKGANTCYAHFVDAISLICNAERVEADNRLTQQQQPSPPPVLVQQDLLFSSVNRYDELMPDMKSNRNKEMHKIEPVAPVEKLALINFLGQAQALLKDLKRFRSKLASQTPVVVPPPTLTMATTSSTSAPSSTSASSTSTPVFLSTSFMRGSLQGSEKKLINLDTDEKRKGPDSFFKAIAEGIKKTNELKPNSHDEKLESIEGVRRVCVQYKRNKNEKEDHWFTKAIQGIDYEKMLKAEDELGERALSGKPEREGKAVCEKLGITLHVIEKRGDQEYGHCLISATGVKTVGEDTIDYHDPKIIHLMSDGVNYFPAPITALAVKQEEVNMTSSTLTSTESTEGGLPPGKKQKITPRTPATDLPEWTTSSMGSTTSTTSQPTPANTNSSAVSISTPSTFSSSSGNL